jgi:hypothetical protein
MQLRTLPRSALRARWPQSAKLLFDGTAAIAASFWIAICCAAPEFIWQGLKIALAHPGWNELLSALLIGVILAFFVEPIMERVRELLQSTKHEKGEHGEPRHALFTVSLSLAFAFASVCLHDAITAFVSGHGGGHSEASAALAAGIRLVAEWAFVPFAVTLAWLNSWHRQLRVPMGIFGGASPLLAGWLFGWPLQSVITTGIPCLAILGFGYRRLLQQPGEHEFAECARPVAIVVMIWFAFALLFDAALSYYKPDRFALYDATDFSADMRFYIGWVLGLTLAPWPYHRTTDATDESSE